MTGWVFVAGRPRPQGSHQARITRDGRPYSPGPSKTLEQWRQAIGRQAREAGYRPIPDTPVELCATFLMPRPRSHKRGDGPEWPIVRPDLDKLIRALCDALTDVAFADDSQVVRLDVTQAYADRDDDGGVSFCVKEVA